MVSEITEEFREYYEDNWEDEEWDDFKDQAIQELYNDNMNQQVEHDYHKLLFCLTVIKAEDENYGGTFKDYDDPTRITNLAYYFIASNIISNFEEEDFQQVILPEEPLTNEEADQEVFIIFGE
jgi:hypothetical protein